MATTEQNIDAYLKRLTIKDYRVCCRARGISPAGSVETLRTRIKEHMMETKDFIIQFEDGRSKDILTGQDSSGITSQEQISGFNRNNYSRPEGQNVGNFMTDRSSSRVLAPPGGGSQIRLGDDGSQDQYAQKQQYQQQSNREPLNPNSSGIGNNNYSRPAGQNVGNFLTDRPTSKVTKPPGGASQITFG